MVKVKKKSSNSYEILLDENVLKTPMKKKLTIQNSKIAEEIYKEWNQDKNILDTDAMIFYGIISTSIDKFNNNRILYVNEILNFIDTDLICYRAEEPNDLVQWQSKNWDPILLKVEKYINNKIDVFKGIMPLKGRPVNHLRAARSGLFHNPNSGSPPPGCDKSTTAGTYLREVFHH